MKQKDCVELECNNKALPNKTYCEDCRCFVLSELRELKKVENIFKYNWAEWINKIILKKDLDTDYFAEVWDEDNDKLYNELVLEVIEDYDSELIDYVMMFEKTTEAEAIEDLAKYKSNIDNGRRIE